MIDDKEFQKLLTSLSDPDETLRLSSADQLGSMGQAAFRTLSRLLNDPQQSKLVRAAVVWGLHKQGKIVVPLLKQHLTDEVEIRQAIVEALGEIRDVEALEPLYMALTDTDSTVRSLASNALAKFGELVDTTYLIQVLNDENAEVREQAAYALGQIKDARAVESLIRILNDENAEVREQAAYALGQIKDARAVDSLIHCLQDNNERVRSWAAKSLGELSDTRMINILNEYLNNSTGDFRYWILWALTKLGDTKAADKITEFLNADKTFLRIRTVEALLNSKHPMLASLLKSKLEDSNPRVRELASEGLQRIS